MSLPEIPVEPLAGDPQFVSRRVPGQENIKKPLRLPYLRRGAPRATIPVKTNHALAEYLSEKAADLGVDRAELIHGILTVWANERRNFELAHGATGLAAPHELIEPYAGYGERLNLHGQSLLDAGLETL